ncbi:MAG: hypothetical protein QOF70_996 [Acetobacteraceae bacterium]|jgi:hypothetical protein|nr:hypothetical protein [Acetobacteraceae bacterium]
MTEPIADDWKAIHDRMQQIRAEQSASFQPCPQCNDLGWIPDFSDRRRPQTVGYSICGLCHNLRDLPPPRPVAGR